MTSTPNALRASIDRVARRLMFVARLRMLLIGVTASAVVLVVLIAMRPVLARWAIAIAPAWSWGMAAAVLVGVLFWLRRITPPASRAAVALWIEEQGTVPPDFSLVTWVEQGAPIDGALAMAATQRFRLTDMPRALRRLQVQRWGAPAALLGGVLLLILLHGVQERRATPHTATSPASRDTIGIAAGAGAALQPWRVVVLPPSYAARPAQELGDVGNVRALEGSAVSLQGRLGSTVSSLPTARLRPVTGTAERPVAVRAVGDSARWGLRLIVSDTPSTVVVSRDSLRRLLIVEGIADSLPHVDLQSPSRDSVFRAPVGVIALASTATDDIGLALARFDVVITSGEGERFTVRSVSIGAQTWRAASAARRAVMRGTLDLATLGLQPGDVIHVRAIARDHHPAGDREFGSSETRAFRIARAAEYDSVAVEPAPPAAVDTSLLSQRMLLLLTQKLDARQRSMVRADVVRESQRLARDQARLRLAVGDVVFQRLSGESSAEHAHAPGDGHDHAVDVEAGKLTLRTSGVGALDEGNDAPVIAINQPLLEAYNAMWDAGRALEQGDPHAAIAPMQRALEAIERSRAASRLFLRGRPPQVIVDVAKVRLTGRDTGQTSARSVRRALPAWAAERDRRLLRLLTSRLASGALRDSLAAMRIESVADAPPFASALAAAIDALDRGEDLTPSLVRARRTLGLVQLVTPGLWSRGVPR